MRKLGALNGAMEISGPLPFDDALRKLKTLTGNWAPDDAMEY